MDLVISVSFAGCAAAFAILAVLIVVGRRGRGFVSAPVPLFLVAASVITAAWAALLSMDYGRSGLASPVAQLLEVLRSGLWVIVLVQALRGLDAAVMHGLLRLIGYGVPALALSITVAGMLLAGSGQSFGMLFVLCAVGQAVAGLILLEQFYRNLASERRWALKHIAVGLGVFFAFDLYLYTDALLSGGIDATVWAARGAVDTLVAPLIAVSASRHRSWSKHLFVSRHVAFHTAALIGAGGYLLVMALGGYYIRDFGGSWGGFAQIVFLAVGVVALLVVLVSGEARTRLRVFLSKHFFSNKYDYREEWLRLIGVLTDVNDPAPPAERAVKAVAQIFDSPGGGVWLLREERDFTPAGHWRLNMPAGAGVGRDHPILQFMQDHKWVVDLDEYRQEPERYQHAPLPDWLEAVPDAWVLLPLFQNEVLYGFMVLRRPGVVSQITWEDRDLLKTLGRQVAMYLGLHESAQALSEARQFEAFNRLTAFIMHDLKNLMAQQSLVVRNAEKHKHNPEFVDDAMMTIRNSVSRMERLLEHLQRGQLGDSVERVRIGQLLQEVERRCAGRLPEPQYQNDLPEEFFVEAARDGLTMVLVHIVRNAQDATPEDGDVALRVSPGGRGIVVEVADNGTGMSEDFIRDRLFRPFDSTKSAKGMGIGAYQAREFVRSMGGELSVQSSPGEGTVFRLELPAQPAAMPRESAGGVSH